MIPNCRLDSLFGSCAIARGARGPTSVPCRRIVYRPAGPSHDVVMVTSPARRWRYISVCRRRHRTSAAGLAYLPLQPCSVLRAQPPHARRLCILPQQQPDEAETAPDRAWLSLLSTSAAANHDKPWAQLVLDRVSATRRASSTASRTSRPGAPPPDLDLARGAGFHPRARRAASLRYA